MTTTTPTLASALAAAQVEMRDPTRNKTASVPNRPTRHYAGLDDIFEAVRPVLARHGLAITQPIRYIDGRPFIVSTLLHGLSGQSVESSWELTSKGDPQTRGSEITYARRYTLEGLVGVAATEDDDGADASPPPPPKPPRAAPVPKPKPGENPDHHPTWAKVSAAFCAQLNEMGMDYKVVAAIAEELGEPRPSAAPPAKRDACLEFLRSDAGRARYAAKVPGWTPKAGGAA
jgi:hypothetical protein